MQGELFESATYSHLKWEASKRQGEATHESWDELSL